MWRILGNYISKSNSNQAQSSKTAAEVRAEALLFWNALKASGLFDHEWYLAQNPDLIAANANPFEHYLSSGWKEGRRPNPVFDADWYMARNADVASSGMNPLVHYWRYGERENRQPAPYFDIVWYRSAYKSDIGKQSALAHYLKHRNERKFSPHRLFDIEYYLSANPDVRKANIDPVEHFVTNGFREGRNPSANFNTLFYVRSYLHGDVRDPLSHYLDIGRAAGLPTNPETAPPTPASEIRRFTSKSMDFEEFEPIAEGSIARAKIVAFYLPQFHSFPENDKWWGDGFTEWTNVSRGTPRFEGHYQPRIPRDLGHYNLLSPTVLKQQVELARGAGIFGFCFYYYNFNGKRLLDAPIELFLQQHELELPFCLMWANENWTRRWDGAESEVLIRQDYREADMDALIDDFSRHFSDPRYIRVSGRPLLIVYRPDIIPDVKYTLGEWRTRFATRHNENPLILMAQGFGNIDPTKMGFDGAIEFPPHKVAQDATPTNSSRRYFDFGSSAPVLSYDDIVRASLTESTPPFPIIKTVFPSWDNDARRQGHGMIVADSSPKKYEHWLRSVIDFANSNRFFGERFAFVNAWNEWAEGAYLEPDVHFGAAYLNATARAVSGLAETSQKFRVLLVGHDAHRHGAQLLLLNLAKTFKGAFGFEVAFLLCGEGEMQSEYAALGEVKVCLNAESIAREVETFGIRGFHHAITNTVAAGHTCTSLKQSGFRVISLVHELPRIIREMSLSSKAANLANSSDEIVFPSQVVKSAFETEVCSISGAVSVLPQGIYQQLEFDEDARVSVRAELGIPQDTSIVLNIGFADLRKGVDLFCRMAEEVQKKRENVKFLWVGNLENSARVWFDDDRTNGNVMFIGQRSDIDRLLSATDVFALTSREDPFPSVVLEALSLGLPVVAFNDGGGFVDVLRDNELGCLVPYCDVSAMSDAVLQRLEAPIPTQIAKSRAANVRSNFEFDQYAHTLATMAHSSLRKISVIVPNFNYAQHLNTRISSILHQSYPIFELIVLDDASTDESVEVIRAITAASERKIRLVRNDTNSGSPFAQWKKGLELAKGDFVWIAEADDIAKSDFLECMVSSFASDRVAFSFSDSIPIDEFGVELAPNYKDYYDRAVPGGLSVDETFSGTDFARRYLSQRNVILNVSSVLWRKSALIDSFRLEQENLAGFRLAGDWLLYLQACLQGDVAYVSTPLNLHRRHAQGVTSGTKGRAQIAEITRIHARSSTLFGSNEDVQVSQANYLNELEMQFRLGDKAE